MKQVESDICLAPESLCVCVRVCVQWEVCREVLRVSSERWHSGCVVESQDTLTCESPSSSAVSLPHRK